MAVYQFSALSDGQAISFNPSADVLQFDQSSIAATEVRALIEGGNLRLRYAETGKDVVLLNTAPSQITIGNVTFADGSRLLFGSDSGNSLLGTSAGDHLWGLGGNDTLNGGSGDDWLAGGTGQDNLTGGTGADAYAFLDTPFNNNYDRVHGFVSGTDSLWLHEEPFADVGALGRFSAGDARFHAAAGATSGHDADDRIIYNTSNGYLFYDADGSGAGKAMLIGILQGAPTLVASDLVLFGDEEVPPPPGDTVVTHERYFTLPEGIANVTVRDPLEPAGFSDGNIVGNAMNNVIRDETSADTFMWLDGAAGDDTLFGGAGPDMFVFYASAAYGDDSVEGGTGYDRLSVGSESAVDVDFRAGTVSGGGTGGSGSVRFADIEEAIGGSFDDRLTADGAGRTLMGGDGNDTLTGGAGNDEIWGEGGFELWAGDGDDLIFGGAGDDTLLGNDGNDTLYGGPGRDLINLAFANPLSDEEIGSDTVVFAEAPDSASADDIVGFQPGIDKLAFNNEVHASLGAAGGFAPNDERFFAGAGANGGQDASDRVVYNTTTGQLWYDADGSGSGAAQLIATLQGAPALTATDIIVFGDGGPGPITGTSGDDSLLGTGGNDTIDGLAGNDTIDGRGGSDSLVGGSGHDLIFGGTFDPFVAEGGDVIVGGEGNDTLNGRNSVFAGEDLNVDTMDGGLGDDYYVVDGDDVLVDAGGVDTVEAKHRDWTLGGGFENLILNTDETEGPQTGIGNGLDNFMRVTWTGRLEGRDGDDTLIGGASFRLSELYGEGGDDVLDGAFGDTLDGGAGNDTLSGGWTMTGGSGADRFELADQVRVTDFASGLDKLRLNGELLSGVGPSGNFSTSDGRFHAAPGATGAHDASDRLIYNTTTGDLYYDPDGTGSAGQTFVAKLEGAPSLLATDIEVVNGTASGSVINGTAGNDSLAGTSGNDTVDGLGGDDTIDGRGGSDSLIGGSGHDLIIGGMFDPFVAEGGDVLVGGEGNDTLDGHNSLFAGEDRNIDTMDGGQGDDYYVVDNDDVLIDAGGNDTVEAMNRDWTLGAGFENLVLATDEIESSQTGIGNELANFMRITWSGRLEGRDGDDTLIGGHNFRQSELYGEGGDDVLQGAFGDTLDGGAGNDTLSGGWTMTGGSGADRFELADQVSVTDFASGLDKLRLNGESLSGVGPSGNFAADDERFHAAPGATGAHDVSDRLIYNTTTGDLYYDPDGTGSAGQTFVAKLEGAPSLLATDIEVVNGTASGSVINGTAGNDSLAGTATNDTIVGFAGNDTLNGAGGDDWLEGGPGQDQLTGGTGADSFVFRDTPFNNNYDRMYGFTSGADELVFDRAAYGTIGAAGEFSNGDGRFYAAAGASSGHDADDRVIYNTSNGYLFYDADGSGAGKAMFVGILQGAPALHATDITII